MPPYIRRHLPLITARIEFFPEPPRPLPAITARVEFNDAQLHLAADAQQSPEKATAAVVNQSDKNVPPAATEKVVTATTATRENRGGSGGDRTTRTKIPKPSGEPGRPGSNGYSLEATMLEDYEWSKGTWEAVNVSFLILVMRVSLTCGH